MNENVSVGLAPPMIAGLDDFCRANGVNRSDGLRMLLHMALMHPDWQTGFIAGYRAGLATGRGQVQAILGPLMTAGGALISRLQEASAAVESARSVPVTAIIPMEPPR